MDDWESEFSADEEIPEDEEPSEEQADDDTDYGE